MCLVKSEPRKEQAAVTFLKWLTEAECNTEFVVETGYMPVNNGSFDKIKNYTFKNDGYESLYTALGTMRDTCTALSEPQYANYYDKVTALYDSLRAMQAELKSRYAAGEDISVLTEDVWSAFTSVK